MYDQLNGNKQNKGTRESHSLYHFYLTEHISTIIAGSQHIKNRAVKYLQERDRWRLYGSG